jgi:hypothetical protein
LRTEVLLSAHAGGADIVEHHGNQQYALTGLQIGNVFADLRDLARDVAAVDVWQFHAGNARTAEKVEMVQRARPDANQDLVLAQNGIGNIFVLQDLRAAEFMNANRFHFALSVFAGIERGYFDYDQQDHDDGTAVP